MTTTYTTIWRLPILAPLDPGTSNSWGSILSAGQPLMEIGAVGIPTINIAGLTTYTLTIANDASDQARQSTYPFIGALTGACTVTIPNIQRWGWASNQTTGGQNVVLTTGSGATLTLPPNGYIYMWQCDGANNITSPGIASTTGYQQIATYNPSGVASVGIALPSGFIRYRLTVQAMRVGASGSTLNAQFSTNGGTSYLATGYANFGLYVQGTTPVGYNQASGSCLLSRQLDSIASVGCDAAFDIFPGTNLVAATMSGRSTGYSPTNGWYSGEFGNAIVVTAPINYINFFVSNNLMAGTLILEGIT